MLDLAAKYEHELQLLFANIAFKKKFMFFTGGSYVDKYKAADSSWTQNEFVSVHNGYVIGYLAYNIDRDANTAYGMQTVNFKDKDNIYFSMDFRQFLLDIFEKFKFRKLSFCCFIGNPIERMYDKYIKKYGGHIVGIEKENVKLFDGNYYDQKLYEILLKDYLKNK